MHSKMFNNVLISTGGHIQTTTVTVIRTKNSNYGNPRYKMQVWITRDSIGNLWTPNVKGYRKTKDDEYIMESYNVDEGIKHFIEQFEKAVQPTNEFGKAVYDFIDDCNK